MRSYIVNIKYPSFQMELESLLVRIYKCVSVPGYEGVRVCVYRLKILILKSFLSISRELGSQALVNYNVEYFF